MLVHVPSAEFALDSCTRTCTSTGTRHAAQAPHGRHGAPTQVPPGLAVAWAYFDTSALVKRYVDEAGRRAVLRLLRGHDVVTSAIVPIELRSALRRRVSDGTLDEQRVPEIVKRVATERGFWALIEVSSNVLTAAEMLVATHRLRALDAIHVASAQLFAGRIAVPELLFVSADARQTAAAAAVGMTIRYIES